MPGRYGFPKGKRDAGESEFEAAWREFGEETGIVLSTGIAVRYLEGSRELKGAGVKKIAAFVASSTDGSEAYISSNLIESGFRRGQPENSGGKWMTVSEAEGCIHKNQAKLLALYASHLRRHEPSPSQQGGAKGAEASPPTQRGEAQRASRASTSTSPQDHSQAEPGSFGDLLVCLVPGPSMPPTRRNVLSRKLAQAGAAVAPPAALPCSDGERVLVIVSSAAEGAAQICTAARAEGTLHTCVRAMRTGVPSYEASCRVYSSGGRG